jgi:short-subunit dehydrogenase
MDKIFLISGASSGIGLITANYLADKGFKVIGISRSIPKTKIKFKHYSCDITKEDQVSDLISKITLEYGKIDTLINCAGMGVSGAIEYSSLEEVEKIISINITGQFILTKHSINLLRKSQNAKIINIGSVAGELTIPFQTFYSMSKAALKSFTEGLRIELSPYNIEAMTLLLGDIKTNFTSNRQQPQVVENDVYGSRIKDSIARMEKDEQNGMDPIIVAKKIYKISSKKHLPIAKTIGFKYKVFVFLNRVLPKRFVLFIIKKMYG